MDSIANRSQWDQIEHSRGIGGGWPTCELELTVEDIGKSSLAETLMPHQGSKYRYDPNIGPYWFLQISVISVQIQISIFWFFSKIERNHDKSTDIFDISNKIDWNRWPHTTSTEIETFPTVAVESPADSEPLLG
jgi:hypothetical protein